MPDNLLIYGRPVFLFGCDFNRTGTPCREWWERAGARG